MWPFSQESCMASLTETPRGQPHRHLMWPVTQKSCVASHTGTSCGQSHRKLMWLATQKSHMACHTGTSCGQSHSNLVWPATKDPHVTSHTGTLCGHSGEKEQPQYPYQHVLIGEGRCCATQTITASMTSETKQMTTVELMGTKAIIWRSWVRPGVK